MLCLTLAAIRWNRRLRLPALTVSNRKKWRRKCEYLRETPLRSSPIQARPFSNRNRATNRPMISKSEPKALPWICMARTLSNRSQISHWWKNCSSLGSHRPERTSRMTYDWKWQLFQVIGRLVRSRRVPCQSSIGQMKILQVLSWLKDRRQNRPIRTFNALFTAPKVKAAAQAEMPWVIIAGNLFTTSNRQVSVRSAWCCWNLVVSGA